MRGSRRGLRLIASMCAENAENAEIVARALSAEIYRVKTARCSSMPRECRECRDNCTRLPRYVVKRVRPRYVPRCKARRENASAPNLPATACQAGPPANRLAFQPVGSSWPDARGLTVSLRRCCFGSRQARARDAPAASQAPGLPSGSSSAAAPAASQAFADVPSECGRAE